MNFAFKVACAVAAVAFYGCSESTGADSDDLGYYVVGIETYELNQNALLLTESQCEVQNGKLFWTRNGNTKTIPAVLDESTGLLQLTYPEYVGQYKYIGNTFPVGEYRSLNAPSGTADGVILEKDNTIRFVFFKKDKCFFDDYNYPISEGSRMLDCNTTEGTNGLITKYYPMEGSSFNYVLSAGKVSCNLEIKTRYPYNEQDCRDAYSDYLKDASSEPFEFKNYNKKRILDEDCIKRLKVELVTQMIMNE